MPQIAFLFLSIAKIYHESYWKAFFKGYEQFYSIYVHAKNLMPSDSYFKQYEIHNKIPTTWANTMRAQIELLREALKDPHNQKFVFISESTIPLQNFQTVYDKLMLNNLSQFAFAKNPFTNNEDRNLLPLPLDEQYFNFQWIILNREHAQLMVDDREYIEIITKYMCDNEHYPSTLLAAKGLLHEITQQDTTLVLWPEEGGYHPYFFHGFLDKMEFAVVTQGIKDGWLFARKFGTDCDLTSIDSYLAYREKFDMQSMKNLFDETTSNVLSSQMPHICKRCTIASMPFQIFFPSGIQ